MVKTFDALVAKMGRSLSIIVMLCLLNNTISKAGPAGPSFVTPWLLFSHVVRCNKTCKLQLAQNRAARMALGCTQGANINNMYVNLFWLKVEERLTSSLLLFMRGIDMLNAPSCLSKILAHSSDTNAYPTRHATRSLFTVPEQTMGGTHYYIEPWLHGTLFHINKLKFDLKNTLWNSGDCEATQTLAQTHTHTQHTYIHMDLVM